MDNLIDVFDWKSVLIDNYKKLGLNETELSIILVVDSFIRKGNKIVTPDLISLKMTIDFSIIDSSLTSLVKKKILNLENNGELEINLQPLKKKLINLFKEENTKDQDELNDKNLSDILVLFESEFARALSKLEVSTIREWFAQGNSVETIKEALKVATYAKVKTIRYIDKILMEWKRRDEISKNGTSAINDKWRKNIDETIEIAKINWMEE